MVEDAALGRAHFKLIATRRFQVGADQRRQAEVECVAVENARERSGDDRAHTQFGQRLHRLLARGADAEGFAADHDVARPHLAGEVRIDRFQAVAGQHRQRLAHVRAGGEHVGVDAVAEYEGLAAHVHGLSPSSSRGSQIWPFTAAAATL